MLSVDVMPTPRADSDLCEQNWGVTGPAAGAGQVEKGAVGCVGGCRYLRLHWNLARNRGTKFYYGSSMPAHIVEDAELLPLSTPASR